MDPTKLAAFIASNLAADVPGCSTYAAAIRESVAQSLAIAALSEPEPEPEPRPLDTE